VDPQKECCLQVYQWVGVFGFEGIDTIFKFTGQQHANPYSESATNRATKIGGQKVCQQRNNQPENAGVSPQVQK
jgi:hypothetical protein